jgi:DNA polymerase elongation subunit (family B)
MVETKCFSDVETVRRDNCRLVSTVLETCLFKMLIDRDVEGAEAYVDSYLFLANC